MATFALVKAKYLQQIADVLRARLGTSTGYRLSQMPAAIAAIDTEPLSNYSAPANTHGETYCIADKAAITAVANAIREKLDSVSTYALTEMPSAILAIDGSSGGSTPEIPEYTDYSFELHPYSTNVGTASTIEFVGNDVVTTWSSGVGDNMIKLFTVTSGNTYLIFIGCESDYCGSSEYLIAALYQAADIRTVSGGQTAAYWTYAYPFSGRLGAARYGSISGTLAVKYSDNVDATQVHVINWNELLNSSDSGQVIVTETGWDVNGAFINSYGYWRYLSSGSNIWHFYSLQAGHSYLIYFPNATDYFGYLVTAIDLSTRKSNYNYSIASNDTGGPPDSGWLYGSSLYNIESNCYLAIWTSEEGDMTYSPYLLDITAFK